MCICLQKFLRSIITQDTSSCRCQKTQWMAQLLNLLSHVKSSLELGYFQAYLIQGLSDIITRVLKSFLPLILSLQTLVRPQACPSITSPHRRVQTQKREASPRLCLIAVSTSLARIGSHYSAQKSDQPTSNETTINCISSFVISLLGWGSVQPLLKDLATLGRKNKIKILLTEYSECRMAVGLLTESYLPNINSQDFITLLNKKNYLIF